MEQIEVVDKNSRICRICLETHNELRSIYTMGKILDQNVKLCDVLAECTSLVFDANDNLPGFLCTKCLVQVSKLYLFRQLAFESNMVLRRKMKSNDAVHTAKDSVLIKPEEQTIVDDDMEYVTVFVSSENGNEQMQLFEPVVMDDYNETIHGSVEFEEEITELEAIEDECNSDLETSVVTDHDSNALKSDVSIMSDKQTMVNPTDDNSADESITASMQGEDSTEKEEHKTRFLRKQSNKTKSFKCEICGKILSNQSSHKYHMQLHSAATPFLCNECGEGFKTRNAYDGHMITHLPSNPNTCEVCGNSYRQAASLRSHMLVHTGEKPFVCGICGKGMTQKSGFKKHMLTHTGEKPHTCDICGKDFRYSSNLINHRRAHLGERNYSCETCKKSFVGSEQLKRHMLIHTGEKPYQCDQCSKAFNRKSTLQIHTKTHTFGRRNNCNVCGKVYVKAQYLETHMKMVHSQ